MNHKGHMIVMAELQKCLSLYVFTHLPIFQFPCSQSEKEYVDNNQKPITSSKGKRIRIPVDPLVSGIWYMVWSKDRRNGHRVRQ